MDDLLQEFLTETTESISLLDLELVRLERTPDDPELLGGIFRLVHTIKGTCGFLGLPRLEQVAHAAENVLGRFRDGDLLVSADRVSVILEALDTIKGIVSALEVSGAEPAGDDASLISRLDTLAAIPAERAAPAEAASPVVTRPHEVSPVDAGGILCDPPGAPERIEGIPGNRAFLSGQDVLPPGREPAREPAIAAQTIRVNVDLLENLMTMVSELVLTRNQLLQVLRQEKDSAFAVPLQHLNHVTSELQESVMRTRMQPIGNAWSKLPRLVRDLGQDLGKKIDLQMRGADTELDRQVLELIKDPLTHMVRNSADHGLENPADRLRAGKPETGCISLNAFHEGGHILIEIADDGRGLDLDRIRRKALQNGLATETELSQMSDAQVAQFIMRPGFSTAQAVTSVSGRGVGMDVVKTNIERIGGTIEIKSAFGKGSAFVIKIPLTLAIISALIVECGGDRFAVPQIGVVELVRAGGEHVIERINYAPVLRLRDRLLPLVSLRGLLRLDGVDDLSGAFIVVAQVGASTFGIIVDRVFDTEEIVVKPVAPILRHIEVFSGNTILGDGTVVMILDANGVATAAGNIANGDARPDGRRPDQPAGRSGETRSLLVFRAGNNASKAVPLSLVARLEEIDRASIEFSNGAPVVQYRGRLMPLVPIDPCWSYDARSRHAVLVFADGDKAMGLVADEIVDIVEDRLDIQLTHDRPGYIGSAVIAGRTTEVVDVGHYLSRAHGDWFGAARPEAFRESPRDRILLVDDSSFFRGLLVPLLASAGYRVRTAENARAALDILAEEGAFDAIVSDIEMPGQSGFEFVQALRSDGRWCSVPVIALTSHVAPRDLERGRQAGFTDYVAKLDRDAVLSALARALAAAGTSPDVRSLTQDAA